MAVNIRSIRYEPYGDALKEHGTKTKAAKALGIPRSTFHDRLKKEQMGIPEGHSLKGVSTLYDNEGNVKQQWVKTQADIEQQQQLFMEAVEAIKIEIPRQKPIEPPGEVLDNLLSCYVLTDYHMGQLSWYEETGDDWDADIAYELLIQWFSSAIKSAPDSKVGVLAQLGDFLHWDGLEALTPTGKNILDADTRFPKLVNLVIRALREVINMMLEKHQHVHVIMAEGNHDLASSVWLRALFAEKYEDEPRVTVDNTHTPYYCYEWGDTSLFFHHGHKARLKNISKIFAGMYRDVFGRTKFSYAHMGHLHHVESKEDQLMIVEQHPTIAAKDAHATRGGYIAQRGASVITYSKSAGEVSRSTIRPEMIHG